jgi:hypothetical protein
MGDNAELPEFEEWIFEARAVRNADARELAELVAVALHPSKLTPTDGHAYSVRERSNILTALKLDRQPAEHLVARLTDELAVCVGLALRSERVIPMADRIEEIDPHFIRPAELLLGTLTNGERSKELLVPWGGFGGFNYRLFQTLIVEFIDRAEKHRSLMKQYSRQAVTWDAELKRYHVRLTYLMCSMITHAHRPSRPKVRAAELDRVASTLAKPLFGGEPALTSYARELIENRSRSS